MAKKPSVLVYPVNGWATDDPADKATAVRKSKTPIKHRWCGDWLRPITAILFMQSLPDCGYGRVCNWRIGAVGVASAPLQGETVKSRHRKPRPRLIYRARFTAACLGLS